MEENKEFLDRYELPEHFMMNKKHPYYVNMENHIKTIKQLLPKGKVLDAGCGDGYGTRKLLDAGYDVVGIDYNEKGAMFANIYNPEAEIVHMDLRNEIYKDKEFDFIFSMNVLEHIHPKYQKQFIKNHFKMLKQEGLLLIQVPSKFTKVHKYHYNHFTPDKLIQLLEEVNDSFIVINANYQSKITWWSKLLYNNYVNFLLDNPIFELRIIKNLIWNIRKKYLSKAKFSDKYQTFSIVVKKRGN